jgi:diaminohydroxyphosphoribosylaminopyrimidine deaminase/5-amino-6-(5-phosphoribosylamino)uracil reductase
LNAPFFKYATTGRPWVALKWAQTIDGKLAYAQAGEERRWISGPASRADAHKLRRRVGAICVGIGTVLADDPMLTPRPSKGRKPVRVVLDNGLRIPLKCRLLRTVKTSPVVIYTSRVAVGVNARYAERITKRGAEILAYDDPGKKSNLHFLVEELGRRGVQQILVEGGPKVLASFLREGLGDEICVYIAPKILGADGEAYIGGPLDDLPTAVELSGVQSKAFGDDIRLIALLTAG